MSMMRLIKSWVEQYFSDEEALFLLLLLIVGFVIVLTLGSVLAPAIASVIVAYLLQGPVLALKNRGMGHNLASILVFITFVIVCLAILLIIVPAVWAQVAQLFAELPKMISKGHDLLVILPERYPQLFSEDQIRAVSKTIGEEIGRIGQFVLSFSLSNLPNLVGILIYLVLVPLLVFFFLKDGNMMVNWWVSLLPNKRVLVGRVWREMDDQFANYIRGKVVEIIAVGVVTYVAFAIMGIRYAALLAILVGLSVVIPYIGAAVVTIPVVLIAYFQWGISSDFYYLVAIYFIIQALDGNVLVPLLFSEAVNLHPVVIILAVLLFGGLWGLWGVFFAIPLATIFKAVITAWPRGVQAAQQTSEE
ncbi:AI-2E family transporter [Oceaniserpentilla sp. 4NH20-0058]